MKLFEFDKPNWIWRIAKKGKSKIAHNIAMKRPDGTLPCGRLASDFTHVPEESSHPCGDCWSASHQNAPAVLAWPDDE